MFRCRHVRSIFCLNEPWGRKQSLIHTPKNAAQIKYQNLQLPSAEYTAQIKYENLQLASAEYTAQIKYQNLKLDSAEDAVHIKYENLQLALLNIQPKSSTKT